MVVLFSRVCFFLCTLAGSAYFLFALSRHCREKPRWAGGFLFHGVFSGLLVLLGVSFLFYYPFNRFGFLADMLSAVFVFGGFVLAFWFRTKKQKAGVIFAHGAALFLLTLWKLGFEDIPFAARLPLNVCNVLILLIIVRPLFNVLRPLSALKPVLDNYTVCFGLIAGLVYFFIGVWFDDTSVTGSFGQGFFYYRMAESALLHNIFLSYCIYTVITKYIQVGIKSAMANMIWIIPWFFLFSFINQIWKTDYFFTGVYGVTPPFLIKLYHAWPLRFTVHIGNRPFELNPLHSLFIIAAAAAILFLVSAALAAFQKTLPEHGGPAKNQGRF
jgi:hypothetical protein